MDSKDSKRGSQTCIGLTCMAHTPRKSFEMSQTARKIPTRCRFPVKATTGCALTCVLDVVRPKSPPKQSVLAQMTSKMRLQLQIHTKN